RRGMARGALKRLALAPALRSRPYQPLDLVQTGASWSAIGGTGHPAVRLDSKAFGPNGASPLVRSSKSITQGGSAGPTPARRGWRFLCPPRLPWSAEDAPRGRRQTCWRDRWLRKLPAADGRS